MLSNEVLTLATCWQIKLSSGEILGFTESDENILISGILHHASSGFSRSAIATNTTLAADNLDAQGIIDHDIIKHEDLLSGRFDHAEVSIFLADRKGRKLALRTGHLGGLTARGSSFTAEIRGLLQAFGQNIGELYSPQCRAQLGDARCKFALSAYKGKVSKAQGVDAFICMGLKEADGHYRYGTLRFSSGANTGFRVEILAHTQTKLTLSTTPPSPMKPGDSFALYPGCDKTIGTCHRKFQNAINFRGEPFIPNVERLLF